MVRRKTVVTVLRRILLGVLTAQLAVAAVLVAIDTWRKRVRPYRAVFPTNPSPCRWARPRSLSTPTGRTSTGTCWQRSGPQHRILFESYILKGTGSAPSSNRRLSTRRTGVEVFVIYDGFANLVVPRRFFDFPPT